MRLVIAATAFAALLAASGAGAQSARIMPAAFQSVSPAVNAGPLAANEILFEVIATGTARAPADRSLISANFMSSGADPAAAQRAVRELRRQLVDTAGRFRAVPTEGDGHLMVGAIGWEANDEYPEPVPGPPPSPSRAHGQLLLELGDTNMVPQLRAALEEAGATGVSGPFHQLQDDAQARRQARADALARARADADEFARAENLRVVRLVRFSEKSSDPLAMMRAMYMFGRGQTGSAEVETQVSAEVAFALAPR